MGNGYLNYTVPLYSKQYINGAWTLKDALIYQNGSWHEWWDYSNIWSNENSQDNINGGYTTECKIVFNSSYATAGEPAMEIDEDGIWGIGNNGSSQNCNVIFNNRIDLTNYSTLKFKGIMSAQNTGWVFIDVYDKIDKTNLTTGYTSNRKAALTGSTNNQVYSVDISTLSGKYYIAIVVFCTAGTAKTYGVRMEKLWLE